MGHLNKSFGAFGAKGLCLQRTFGATKYLWHGQRMNLYSFRGMIILKSECAFETRYRVVISRNFLSFARFQTKYSLKNYIAGIDQRGMSGRRGSRCTFGATYRLSFDHSANLVNLMMRLREMQNPECGFSPNSEWKPDNVCNQIAWCFTCAGIKILPHHPLRQWLAIG